MKKPLIIEVICGSLVLLFAYTAFSKLADFEDFQRQLSMQVFPPFVVEVLLYLIPGIELVAVILIIV
ncbi:MauE/DoxX family redox-associated membrane protein [Pedobacter sp. NJ-S-72]